VEGPWRANIESTSPALTQVNPGEFYINNLYSSGAWNSQPADLTQWMCIAWQTGGAAYGKPKMAPGGIGMERLSGGGLRYFVHTYNQLDGNVNGNPAYYSNSLWPNMSPDGRFCVFKSNMNNLDGFSSLFAAIMPTS
jgi:hypothetical protein